MMMTMPNIARLLTGVLVCLFWMPPSLAADKAADKPLGAPELESRIRELPRQSLSEDESRQLRHLYAFQKLLRDVYAKFYTHWHLHDFKAFQSLKQQHLQAVAVLFDKYGLEPPGDPERFGTFQISSLQKLYANFTKTGRLSLFEALRTAATMEDFNIYTAYDLLMDTDNQDIKLACRTMTLTSRSNLQEIQDLLNSYGEKMGGNIWMW